MKDVDIFQFEYDNYCYNNVAIKWENIETLKISEFIAYLQKIIPILQFYEFPHNIILWTRTLRLLSTYRISQNTIYEYMYAYDMKI